MKNEFIPYEQALKLKKLRFNEPTLGYYQFKILKIQPPILKKENQNQDFMREEDCSAPLWQQAFDWFREKYFLYFEITEAHIGLGWDVTIINLNASLVEFKGGVYYAYEEALDLALYLRKIIENNNDKVY